MPRCPGRGATRDTKYCQFAASAAGQRAGIPTPGRPLRAAAGERFLWCTRCIWCCCSTVSLHHWTLETGEQVWFQVLVHSSALQGNHIQPRLSKLNKSIEQIHQVKDKVIFCYSLFRHKHQNSCFNSVVT